MEPTLKKGNIVSDRVRAKKRSAKMLKAFRESLDHTETTMSEAITARGYHVDRNGYHNWERKALPPHEVLLILCKMGLDLNKYIKGEGY